MPTARSDDDVPPLLRGARVHDVMHAGVLSCPAGTSVRDAARLMALSHVHCVVVEQAAPRGGERDWVLLSDVDVLAALVDGDEDAPAAARAGAAPLTVGAEEPLSRAARLMAEHRASHVLVLAAGSGRPAGVLSTLDVAALAGRGDA